MGLAILGDIETVATWALAAAAGVVLLAPWMLRGWERVRYARGARGWRERVLRRYRRAGVYAWMFAWFKTRMDPMFGELPKYVQEEGGERAVRAVLDVGCGYGVAGCAVLEWVEGSRIHGVEPKLRRVEAARAAFGEEGRVELGRAPDFWIPEAADGFDAVLMLDMAHFLSDGALEETLQRVHKVMNARGRLIVRVAVPAEGSEAREATGEEEHMRTLEEIGKAVMGAGFKAVRTEKSENAGMWWVTASA